MKKPVDLRFCVIIGILLVVCVIAFISLNPDTQKAMIGVWLDALKTLGILIILIIPITGFMVWLIDRKPRQEPPHCPTCGQELPEENPKEVNHESV